MSPSVTNLSATSDFVPLMRSLKVKPIINHVVSRDPNHPSCSLQSARSSERSALERHQKAGHSVGHLLRRVHSRSNSSSDKLVCHRQASALRPILISLICPNPMPIWVRRPSSSTSKSSHAWSRPHLRPEILTKVSLTKVSVSKDRDP